MAKTASPIKHSRTEKDDTYIEERGLRRIELHTEKPPGKKSIFDSEYPFRFRNRRATSSEPLRVFLKRRRKKR